MAQVMARSMKDVQLSPVLEWFGFRCENGHLEIYATSDFCRGLTS